MIQKSIFDLSKPELESKAIWNIVHGLTAYPAIVVAYDFGIFELLSKKSYSDDKLCKILNLHERATQGLLAVLISLELLEKKDDMYFLTDISKVYLLESSPFNMCSIFSMFNSKPHASSIESLKKSLKQNKAQVYDGEDVFASHADNTGQAKFFTKAMHSISMAPALYWPDKVDLSKFRSFLDIAGGSGAHSLGVLKYWKKLNATVFDIAPVCEVTNELINEFSLSSRMSTHVGDLWESDFPCADVHFYSQIFHDWYFEKCEFLAQKSFKSLTSGGMIILHEVLFNKDKLTPFSAAAASISMLRWTEGKQYSFEELKEILHGVGFCDITTVKTGFNDWSIIMATKPWK